MHHISPTIYHISQIIHDLSYTGCSILLTIISNHTLKTEKRLKAKKEGEEKKSPKQAGAELCQAQSSFN